MPVLDVEDDVDGLHHNASDDQLYRGPGDHLQFEQYRLETFHNWPLTANVDKQELARNGFYYLGQGDRVKCAFCNVILSRWDRGDVVSTEHRRHAPNCSLLTNPETAGNIPHQEVVVTNNQQNGPKYPSYKTREMRLRSFCGWPSDIKQRPEELASAGFFYLGSGDAVKCFHCGGILRSWDESDVPWEEHKSWFPMCGFIIENDSLGQRELHNKMRRSIGYIAKENGYTEDLLNFHKRYTEENGIPYPITYEDLVDELEQLRVGEESQSSGATGYSPRTRHSPAATATSENQNEIQPQERNQKKNNQEKRLSAIKTQWSVDERFQCKICFENHVEVIFLPCKHVCCCQSCFNKLKENKCPICRSKIKGAQPLYFA